MVYILYGVGHLMRADIVLWLTVKFALKLEVYKWSYERLTNFTNSKTTAKVSKMEKSSRL